MAAKRRSTTPKRLDLDDGAVTHLHPDLLDFDFENPRLAESVAPDGHTESDLLRFLWKEMNVKEVALSIVAKGYFEHEPLFAVKHGPRYTVIEGNRRLAAIKILRAVALREELNVDLPTVRREVLSDLESLPVVVTTRKRVWQYIGFKHVNGPKPWGAVAKAKYIAQCVNEFKVSLDDIPNMIGDTHATVRRLYRGLMILQSQAHS